MALLNSIKGFLTGKDAKNRVKTVRAIHGTSTRRRTALQRTVERQRIAATEDDYDTDPLRDIQNFTPAEKASFYDARETLNYLPITGPRGSYLQRISDALEAQGLQGSRQYVYQTFYPNDPARLFRTRSRAYKQIWVILKQLVDNHTAIGSRDPVARYVEILKNLATGKSIFIRNLNPSHIEYFRSKIEELGWKVQVYVQKDKSPAPHNYLFIRTDNPSDEPEAGTGALELTTVKRDLVKEAGYRMEYPVHVYGERSTVDRYFPGFKVERPEGAWRHYVVRPNAA